MLPSPFPYQYLGELIEGFEAGVNYSPISENEPASEWRVLKISAVTWGDFNPKESKPIKPNTTFDDSLIVKKGDLIMSRANTTELVGAVSLVRNTPPKVLLSDKLWRIKFPEHSRLLPEYALLALRQPTVRKIIGDLATGSSGSMQNISMEKAATIPIPLPPLEEQKQIASIAQKCDRLRRTRRYTQQLSDTYLQSVFLEMFGDPITNPMNWDIDTLGTKLTFITSGSRGWAEFYAEDGDYFLRVQNVGRNELLLNDLAYVKAPDSAEARRTQVKGGDVLISITADLGRTAVIPENFPKAYINQHLCLIRVQDINPIFLASYLSSEGGQYQFDALDRSGVKSGLNFDDIRSLKIILPPLSLQEKFAQIVQRYERLRTQQREAERQAEHLFQTILHRAFRGEL